MDTFFIVIFRAEIPIREHITIRLCEVRRLRCLCPGRGICPAVKAVGRVCFCQAVRYIKNSAASGQSHAQKRGGAEKDSGHTNIFLHKKILPSTTIIRYRLKVVPALRLPVR